MKFDRIYKRSEKSTLLLGPRGTGKSTFFKNELKPDLTLDLLRHSTFRQLSLDPSSLEAMVSHLKKKQSVFIDEIQRLPELLNEVHRLIEEKGLVFFLTGSSARKLRRAGTNLLAGRAASKKIFPLCLREIGGSRPLEYLIEFGQLPKAVTETDGRAANEFIFSYVETYLKEEIFQEALVRNLSEFSKFVELAGQYHGQILNFENISRELGKSGDTVKSWFQILQDTLVGYILEPYPLNIVARESKHPRFYYFDCGVARAAEGLTSLTEAAERRGHYFESIILNELKVYLEVQGLPYKIYYYSAANTGDIDFIVELKKKSISSPAKLVCIEVKLAKNWKPEFGNILQKIQAEKPKEIIKTIGIYSGDRRLTKGALSILPLDDFVSLLWKEEFF